MLNTIETISSRIFQHLLGNSDRVKLDIRHDILDSTGSTFLVRETGGNSARYHLFNHCGMKGFVSVVAEKPDNTFVYSIGKKSKYIKFDILSAFEEFNRLDKNITKTNKWAAVIQLEAHQDRLEVH